MSLNQNGVNSLHDKKSTFTKGHSIRKYTSGGLEDKEHDRIIAISLLVGADIVTAQQQPQPQQQNNHNCSWVETK